MPETSRITSVTVPSASCRTARTGTDSGTHCASGPSCRWTSRAPGPGTNISSSGRDPCHSRTRAVLQRAHGADPVDPEAPHVTGPVAVGVQIPMPVDGGDLQWLHRARGQLVVGAGEVVDVEGLAGVRRCAHRSEGGRRVDVEPDRLAGAERGIELGQGAAQRAVLRARHREQQAGRCRHREPLGGRQAARPGVLRREEGPDGMLGDLDLHQRVRGVRRNAAAGRELQLGHQFLLAHPEPQRGVGDRRLPHLRQPADQRQEAPEAPARLPPRRAAWRRRLLFGRRDGERRDGHIGREGRASAARPRRARRSARRGMPPAPSR